ncbi:MAG: hypothetical protein ACE5I1_14070 [bacterium]
MGGYKNLLLLFIALLLFAANVYAQEKSDSTKSAKAVQVQDTTKTQAKQDIPGIEEELVLGEISIEAIIEKPNVDIISKRKKPEIEEISFIDRSFEAEIKEVPKDFHLYDKELDEPKKLDKLRKILTKDKKKK